MNAQVVVVLGLVGGFLTPPLLTSGNQSPLLLFGYVALLNAGIAAVAIRKKWDYLLLLAAIGTVITEWLWLPTDIPRASTGFFVFLFLEAQFLAIAFIRQRISPPERWSTPGALVVGFSALGFAAYLLHSLNSPGDPDSFLDTPFSPTSACLRWQCGVPIPRVSPGRPARQYSRSSRCGPPAGCTTIFSGGRSVRTCCLP